MTTDPHNPRKPTPKQQEVGNHLEQLKTTLDGFAPVKHCRLEFFGKICHALILCEYKTIENLYLILNAFIGIAHHKWTVNLPHSMYDVKTVQLELEVEGWTTDDIIREIDYKNCLVKQALGR